ncbi:hypothetical protein PENFLA_c005G10800 [Penicillium flavigenum]|uniref:Aminoglycoside phosphotransferase domain-containing protein n=1 Tax=Penicillium flavigenum TaxID=254877 RepID=A0A1V6TPD4_9EURO|nr:hypothetical protein PENFLA_c005G10800 [Penicillium flavigenum]
MALYPGTRCWKIYKCQLDHFEATQIYVRESTSGISTTEGVDIAPRNILVDEENNATGVIDWEYAGWYPEYWEYAQIMRPAFGGDWSVWMDKTAPQRWDLGGINAARKVLF